MHLSENSLHLGSFVKTASLVSFSVQFLQAIHTMGMSKVPGLVKTIDSASVFDCF